jgi:hypothetical protein
VNHQLDGHQYTNGQELARRCLHLERIKVPVSQRNVIWRWNWFGDLLGNEPELPILLNLPVVYMSNTLRPTIAYTQPSAKSSSLIDYQTLQIWTWDQHTTPKTPHWRSWDDEERAKWYELHKQAQHPSPSHPFNALGYHSMRHLPAVFT